MESSIVVLSVMGIIVLIIVCVARYHRRELEMKHEQIMAGKRPAVCKECGEEWEDDVTYNDND